MLKGLSLERLQTFQMVAEAAGIAKAADGSKSREAQFSKQIGELEEHFRTELLRRGGNSVSLTEDGTRLAEIVREFQKRLNEFRDRCEAKPVFLRLGAGDRLLHWFVIPCLSRIQAALPENQIQLHNCTTRLVLERINTLSLDVGIIRSCEMKKGLRSFEIQSRFTYSLFVPLDKAPPDRNAVWIIQNVPLAIVERYQTEFLSEAEKKRIRPKVHLLCSTFPQARRAVTSGYAAILPTAAFSTQEMASIRKFDLPFSMPRFEKEETTISVVWNRRLEEIRDNFPDVLKAFRENLGVLDIAKTKPAVASSSK